MSTFNQYFLQNPIVPWRIRNRVERWLYDYAKDNMNWAFRLAFLGKSRPLAQAVTSWPKHHFFGYYDKSPWSIDDNLLLCHEVEFIDRQPEHNDNAGICVIDAGNTNKIERVGNSRAWSWQQGAMLRWHPVNTNEVLFNDRIDDHYVCRTLDITTGKESVLDYPLYDITPDGKIGLSLNFARLHTRRPGYGYAGTQDPWESENHSHEDGIRRIELDSGKEQLLVSLDELRRLNPSEDMKNVPHWVNHIQVNPSGTRLLFLHRWGNATASGGFNSRLYSIGIDGSELRCLLNHGHVSHYDWLDDNTFVVWAYHPIAGEKFYCISETTGAINTVGEHVLREDGHCNFSPDRNWMVTDTYPSKYNLRRLSLYQMHNKQLIDIELLHAPRSIPAELRCDLHPRWNRRGDHICIDSIHEGSRQLYVLDITDITR